MEAADNLRVALCMLASVAAIMMPAGCGMPGAPQPPTLNLPQRVTDLSAVRAGNEVSLVWTMPTKNTDKLLLKGTLQASICQRQSAAESCSSAGSVQLAPGETGKFTATLPLSLATGRPRMLSYFIELKNRNGRSAGLSNEAAVAAGEAPAAITGLSAEMRRDGVLLHWASSAADTGTVAVRLQRKLLTPHAAKSAHGVLAPAAEPVERNLLVETDAQQGRALDKDAHFGETYEYRAQQVARISVDNKVLELAGALSAPVRIAAVNVLPPAVPAGLAAVAMAGENGGQPAIDLSWQSNTEADLAGYAVYRREGDAIWQRISSAQPQAEPAFHDATAHAGHTYSYAVTAIDADGHESARSGEAQMAPNP